MYELIQLTDRDYYIDCPAKIGIVDVGGGEVVLIDSGSDKDAGKKVLRILETQGWKLRAIFNTHAHADHIGGNHVLQERTGCRIFARGLERAYAGDPILEPAGLYGGLPFKELRHKFLMAQESTVEPLTEDALPEGFRLLELPGHSSDMTGFLTPDGTAYIGDCVSSAETLNKYGIGYLWDPARALATLEYVQTLEARRFVPAHAGVAEDIGELARLNIGAINAVKTRIAGSCEEPVSFEMLLKKIFDDYGLAMSAQQYVLIGSTVRSYLSAMYTEGILTYEFSDNRMLWKTV